MQSPTNGVAQKSVENQLQTVPRELLEKLAEQKSPILLEKIENRWEMREFEAKSLKQQLNEATTRDDNSDKLLFIPLGEEKIVVNPREIVIKPHTLKTDFGHLHFSTVETTSLGDCQDGCPPGITSV